MNDCHSSRGRLLLGWFGVLLLVAGGGCHVLPYYTGLGSGAGKGMGLHSEPVEIVQPPMPRELMKVALPEYTVEPPDILIIDALQVIPKSPYNLRTGDVLSIQVTGTLPELPIAGPYPLEPGGFVNLGVPYGQVKVVGMTVEDAEAAILEHLKEHLADPTVSVALLQMGLQQQITGQHLVGPDGMVTLGTYGKVSVVGKTLPQVADAIERQLSQYLEDPQVSATVFAYNSKVYYIVTEGAGLGDAVYRLPVTGNETVLDAIANINGLTQVSSKKIWIARPTPDSNRVQILPVDWVGITAQGTTETNYQILPGDRVFVAEDELVAFDTSLGKLLSPFERMMGFVLLGTGTATRLSGKVLQGGGNPGTGGGGGGF
jgi:polysaccharide export outer membrane protein